jgi:hypothetical protein
MTLQRHWQDGTLDRGGSLGHRLAPIRKDGDVHHARYRPEQFETIGLHDLNLIVRGRLCFLNVSIPGTISLRVFSGCSLRAA